MHARTFHATSILIALATAGLAALPAHAVMPVVKTVPWVATNPLIPHTTFPGKSVRLKGTTDVTGSNFEYKWDFGDGTETAWANVGTANYALEAAKTYTGPVGTIYTARLHVRDKTTGDTATRTYFVEMKDQTLAAEVNVAIGEGLWYLHKTQTRSTSGGFDLGVWSSGNAASSYAANQAANLNAFFVNGHLETGSADNPYTETVQRGMRRLFQYLTTRNIAGLTQTNPLGTFTPDANGNGISIYVNQADPYYQGGQVMDAIVASGTPGAIAATGVANVAGRRYVDIVQDMVDEYSYCQYDASPGGGWRYSCNQYPDNSANQWGAIGLIAAEHFGATVPAIVKNWNVNWLRFSQNATATANNGLFGYTDTSPIWGPYAVTPSGMVQMVMSGIGRGSSPANGPSWENAESFLRENWDNTGGATTNIKAYYYGLLSFTKAMLLHDPNGDGVPETITCLRSLRAGTTKLPIDWYGAQAGQPDTLCGGGANASSHGVARTLVNNQNVAGYWYGFDYTSTIYPFDTAWAIMMLNRTVFESGVPVAVANVLPNPSVAGQVITLDGSGSFHQDPGKSVDSWQWDFNNDGIWDATGPTVTTSFPALGNYPVTLRVTDDGSPEKAATTTVMVNVSIPPLAPTANAGGPYNFCPQTTPWFLDGTASVNPDEGQFEPGHPGDTIQAYEWDLTGNGQFNDAFGAQPDVTAAMQALGVGSHLVQLRVTDTTSTSFPSSGQPDLSSTAGAQVFVRDNADPACACITNLAARAKSGKIQLTWTAYPGATSYNVYRSTISGGPYAKIANTTSTYSTYLDGSVINGTTYHYVVRAAALNGNELCQSNQASARASAR